MRRKIILLCPLLFLLGALCSSEAGTIVRTVHPDNSIGIEQFPEARDLYRFTEEQRAKYRWPALGIGVVHRGRIVGLGMAGERKRGSGNWTTLADRFDMGSCAKSITATAAALLVDEGKLRWNTRVIDVFPEWHRSILPVYTNVTLEQLLTHRSGLDQWMNSNPKFADWNRRHAGKSATEQRIAFALAALQRPPRHPPGSAYYYCNDGYFIAGCMIEKVSGQSFEELTRRRIFGPLKLESAGFGARRLTHDEAAVWGHEPRSFRRTLAIAPEPAEYGDPPFGTPGGFLTCSVPDLLLYVNVHIQGARGDGRLLKPETFDRLHTPGGRQLYAMGWNVEVTRDTGGRIVERSIYHGGYSGRFRANMWFCPESHWGTVIVCNYGGGDGSEMAAVFLALLKEFKLQ